MSAALIGASASVIVKGFIHVSFCRAPRTDEESSQSLPDRGGAAQDYFGKGLALSVCVASSVGSLLNLRRLEIATYPDPSFDSLIRLRLLEELHITHMPEIGELSPLGSLKSLRVLTLQTLPSWDSSGKVTKVRSLAALAALTNLEELGLFGVVPTTRMADELLASRSLRRVRLSKYASGEAEKVAAWVADLI